MFVWISQNGSLSLLSSFIMQFWRFLIDRRIIRTKYETGFVFIMSHDIFWKLHDVKLKNNEKLCFKVRMLIYQICIWRCNDRIDILTQQSRFEVTNSSQQVQWVMQGMTSRVVIRVLWLNRQSMGILSHVTLCCLDRGYLPQI